MKALVDVGKGAKFLRRGSLPEFAFGDTDALCGAHDPELFFPIHEGEDDAQVRAAKSVCRGCPLQEPCLEFALAYGEVGVWAGTTTRERRRIREAAKR